MKIHPGGFPETGMNKFQEANHTVDGTQHPGTSSLLKTGPQNLITTDSVFNIPTFKVDQ